MIAATVVLALVLCALAVRVAVRSHCQKTPEGGINESMYVQLGGVQQWINIYGVDINSPVLLCLHGGPGSATSQLDYVITRKWADVSLGHFNTNSAIMQKYGFDMMANGADYALAPTLFFNPNYSLRDWGGFFRQDMRVYMDFIESPEFPAFSIKGRTEYAVPYYNINGNRDYQTNYILAEEYFTAVDAPEKQLFIMDGMTHGLLESDSAGFSVIVHTISQIHQ